MVVRRREVDERAEKSAHLNDRKHLRVTEALVPEKDSFRVLLR
jgi:hypothetical protein